ncbi:MAG: glycerol-3-phosphate 1-O-acyltransferase PlsY [Pseudomonadota bacterium]
MFETYLSNILANSWLAVLVPLAVGYLCGSIPFGLLLAKLGGAGDVRSIGSGNIGATNVLRTGRKGLAAATLVADALKAAIPVWFFGGAGVDVAMFAGFGAFFGHLFPIWLGFKGGKGIAVYVGVLLALSWQALLAFAVLWLSTAAITRYSSLAALVATTIVPLFVWIMLPGMAYAALILATMTVISFFMHRANISRLLAGTETRIGSKS